MGAEIVQVLLIIDLHNIAHNLFIPHPFQFNPEGFNVFALTSAVIIPCIMLACITNIDLRLRKAPCATAPAHPEEMPLGIAVSGSLPQLFYIVLEVGLIIVGVMLHNLLQGFQHIYILKMGVPIQVVALPLEYLTQLCHDFFSGATDGAAVMPVSVCKIFTHINPKQAQALALGEDKVAYRFRLVIDGTDFLKHPAHIVLHNRRALPDLSYLVTGHGERPQGIIVRAEFGNSVDLAIFHVHPPVPVRFPAPYSAGEDCFPVFL